MKYCIVLILSFLLISCEKYDSDTFEIAGVYEASIVGLNGSFNMPISIEYGDDIIIEAPFDGTVWDIVYADIDCSDCDIKDIDIQWQELDDGVSISGRGAYSFGTIQLDYEMTIFGEVYVFTLIGSK